MKKITQSPFLLLLILCSCFLVLNTTKSYAQTAEDVSATFGIQYEPIGDGSQFTGTLYLEDRTSALVAIGMNLQTDSENVHLTRNETNDCVTSYANTVCNPRADFASNLPYQVRWNWTSASDTFTTFPQPFIQLTFTCLTTGVVQPITDAITTELYSSDFRSGASHIEFPTYDCPMIGTPDIDPTVPQEPPTDVPEDEIPAGLISGLIWSDEDANSVMSVGDIPIERVTIILTDSYGVTYTTVTDTNGEYIFTDFPLDVYTITVDATTLPFALVENTYDPDNVNGEGDRMSVVSLTDETPERTDQDFGFGIQDSTIEELPTIVPDTPITPEPTDDEVIATFGIQYEPIGDGSQFVGTVYLADRTSQITAIGMNLHADLETVHLTRNNVSDCDALFEGVICNPRADFRGLDGYQIRWNWTSITDPFTTFPHDFIQLEFTCLTTGVIEPITDAIATDVLLEDGLQRATSHIDLSTYDCPAIGTPNIDPSVPQEPQSTPVPAPIIDSEDVTEVEIPEHHSQDFEFPAPEPITGIISDTLYIDENYNGVQDPTETGIPNATVTIISSVGVTETTTTDENGEYLFNGLSDGEYTISIDSDELPEYLQGTVAGEVTWESVDRSNDVPLTNDDSTSTEIGFDDDEVVPTAITLTSAESPSPLSTQSILTLLLLPIGISTVAVYRSRK